MASIITFDGARAALGDEWTEENRPSSFLGDAAYTFLGWGVLTFAVATGAIRAWRGLGLDKAVNRMKQSPGSKFDGARRRRRKR